MSDDGYQYIYERYDQAGRFYVVRKLAPDDLSYVLVMMPTGQGVGGVRCTGVGIGEVEVPDHRVFLATTARQGLVIQAPAGDGLATEAEFPLPCDAESCSARWDHQSWISVTCAPRGGGAAKRARSSC